MKEKILEKIKSKTITIGVIGLGYVGLALAVEKANSGFKTIGFDINLDRVNSINNTKSYITDVTDEMLKYAIRNEKLIATDKFSELKKVDIITICVPTPLDVFKQPDLSYIKSTSETIGVYLKKGSTVILESTTYPGTTEELIKPMLEKISGLQCGKDFYLGFSPERVDPGNKQFISENIPRVVGGIGEEATEIITALYTTLSSTANIFKVTTPAVAEMEKLLENTFRNVNIALINQLAVLCKKMNISIWEVIEAAKSKPYGYMAFYPGCGVGGHCIPLDPCYLQWKAKEYDFHTTLIECATNINDSMSEYCLNRISKILNKRGKTIFNSNILFLGVAYKQDINDCRESPAIKLIEEVIEEGGKINYYDSYVNICKIAGENKKSLEQIDEKILTKADLVVITTSHTNLDYNLISNSSKYIFDIKNAMKNIERRDNIEVL